MQVYIDGFAHSRLQKGKEKFIYVCMHICNGVITITDMYYSFMCAILKFTRNKKSHIKLNFSTYISAVPVVVAIFLRFFSSATPAILRF